VDEIGEKKFSAKLLVDGLMESSFGSSPQEWAEIIKMEKALEKYDLIIAEGEGKYSAPCLVDLRGHFYESKSRGTLAQDFLSLIIRDMERLGFLKRQLTEYSVPEDFVTLKEHIDTIQRIADAFATGFSAIEKELQSGNHDHIPGELEKMEAVVIESSGNSGDNDDGRPRSQLTTVFRITEGEKTVEKNFTSPCYDLVSNALKDYHNGILSEKDFIGTVQSSLEHIVEFHEFCTGELEWLNENDSELYNRYRDVVASLSRSQLFCKEGAEKIISYFDDHDEEDLDRGMEIFFRGVQELACIFVLLDHLKRSGY
jgi:hypothetical protein